MDFMLKSFFEIFIFRNFTSVIVKKINQSVLKKKQKDITALNYL